MKPEEKARLKTLQMNGKMVPELPENWVWTTLGGCVGILDRKRVPVNANDRGHRILGKSTSELYPYYGATGQVGWIDDYLFGEELVLLGEDGVPFLDALKNKAYLIKGKSWINNHAHALRALTDITSNVFICHYLNIFDYNGYVTGTTRLKLNQAQMRQIPIPLSPPPEQHRIVTKIEELFTRLDAGVGALTNTKAQLKHYHQSVLKSACEGRLVPTEAELARAEGRDYEPADVLLSRIGKERREKWGAEKKRKGRKSAKYKEPAAPDVSGLPELPEGWVWTTVEQLGDIDEQAVLTGPFGSNLGRRDFIDSGVPVLTIGCLTEQGLSLEKPVYVSKSKASELGRYKVKAGDVLFSRMATVGRAGLVSIHFEDAIINYHLMRLRLAVTAIDPVYFITHVRGSKTVADYIKVVNHGATRDGINTSQLMSLPVALPPLLEQHRIVAEIERRLSVADEIEKTIDQSLKQAERLRQSILKKAFEGKLVPQDPDDEPASVLLEQILLQKEINEQNSKSKRRKSRGQKTR